MLICLVAAVAGGAALAVSLPYNTTFSGGSPVRTLGVSANVTWITDPGVHYHYYWYQYIVTFNDSTAGKNLRSFNVENDNRLEWIDAYTSRPGNFTAAMVYDPIQTSVGWATTTAVSSVTGQTIEFGYYSRWGYGVTGNCSAGGGGYSTSGSTLGMVPEPGTLAAVGLGLSGMAGYLVRGSRRRRK